MPGWFLILDQKTHLVFQGSKQAGSFAGEDRLGQGHLVSEVEAVLDPQVPSLPALSSSPYIHGLPRGLCLLGTFNLP
jgi:hypothetical protein